VSANGSVVVGTSGSYPNERAFRWTSAAGTEDLGTLPGHDRSNATGVSGDGSMIIGGRDAAFLWTAAGMQPLGFTNATGISADGSVIVGYDDPGYSGGLRAIRWTESGGAQRLESHLSYLLAVSADGKSIVGGTSAQAFRWRSPDDILFLGEGPGGLANDPIAVSGDGSIIICTDTSPTPLIWDSTHGMRMLRDALINEFGLNLDGWSIEYASGISADGRVIVGSGYNPSGQLDAWIAVLPEPTALPALTVTALATVRKIKMGETSTSGARRKLATNPASK
jgi:probable HAF family extracellular repeat protein